MAGGLNLLVIYNYVLIISKAFQLDIKLAQLQDKIIDIVATKIEEQIPFPLPFNIRAILKNPKADISITFPKQFIIEEAIKLKPQIPEEVKQPVRDLLDNLELKLDPIIEAKNAIISAIEPIQEPLKTLDKVSKTGKSIIDPLDIAIKVLKTMPVPTAVGTPAVAITVGVINTFGTVITTAEKVISATKGPLDAIDSVVTQATSAINSIAPALGVVDDMMSQVTGLFTVIRVFLGDPIETIDPLTGEVTSTTPMPFPPTEADFDAVLQAEGRKINAKTLKLPGPLVSNSDPDKNLASNKALLKQLSPNANPPYIYRGYKCIIQSNPDPFSLPSNRIQGTFIKNSTNTNPTSIDKELLDTYQIDKRLGLILEGSVIYNIPAVAKDDENDVRITGDNDNPYSFATSIQVLVSEIQLQIDKAVNERVDNINLQNSRIVYDSTNVKVGNSPYDKSVVIDMRDDKAIEYVQNLKGGKVFESYRSITEHRSFVYALNTEVVYTSLAPTFFTRSPESIAMGKIPGEYGTVLNYGKLGAINYVQQRGGIVLDSYLKKNPIESFKYWENETRKSKLDYYKSLKFQGIPYTYPPMGSPSTLGTIQKSPNPNNSVFPELLWEFTSNHPSPPPILNPIPNNSSLFNINPSSPPLSGEVKESQEPIIQYWNNDILLGSWKNVTTSAKTTPFDSFGKSDGEERYIASKGWDINVGLYNMKTYYKWSDAKLRWVQTRIVSS
jgi:hypothetical protein